MVLSMWSSFDVDWGRLGNGFVVPSVDLLDSIRQHVSKCPLVKELQFRDSASGNGFHVQVTCDGEAECETCRMVFDSPSRLDLDDGPLWTRGVLWDEKTYVKGGCRLRGVAGAWMTLSTS